jgi:hypothetical protein
MTGRHLAYPRGTFATLIYKVLSPSIPLFATRPSVEKALLFLYTPDGTTPASRFFRRSLPDLLESVLSQIDELPLPRQHYQALTISA